MQVVSKYFQTAWDLDKYLLACGYNLSTRRRETVRLDRHSYVYGFGNDRRRSFRASKPNSMLCVRHESINIDELANADR